VALDRERVHGQRVRPARGPRWRSYAPAIVTTLLAASLIPAGSGLADLGARIALPAHASVTIAAGLVVLLTSLTAALCDQPPARWYIAGVFAVSLGGNVAPTTWVSIPLVATGVIGLLVREVERGFDGITLGPAGLTIHRPLKDPLTVDYEDVRAVHTTPSVDDDGTLILETEHGTVTAGDLPAVGDLKARIEARTGGFDVDDPQQTAREVRERIQDIVRGKTPT